LASTSGQARVERGTYGPFPAALEALQRRRTISTAIPTGRLCARVALAEGHDVRFEQVAVGSGADGVIDCLSQAVLEDGDEIVCGWPSFPSYVLAAIKLGALPVRVPLREHRYDLDALLDAITPQTKLVYVCVPNNPTGTTNGRAELTRFLDQVPGHVLTVLDQAYAEYIDDPDYPDGVEEYFNAGRRVVVLRTFSKIYGLAGLRVGYGVAPADVVLRDRQGAPRLRRLLGRAGRGACEPGRRAGTRARRAACNGERARLVDVLARVGFDVAGPQSPTSSTQIQEAMPERSSTRFCARA
jgi:histidinol-phosphate aminotransferase